MKYREELNLRAKVIVIERIMNRKTFQEIGDELGIKKQRAHQIYKKKMSGGYGGTSDISIYIEILNSSNKRARAKQHRIKNINQHECYRIFRAAIKNGDLNKISREDKCVDCGKQAKCYDHRDYDYPLKVDIVCSSCNSRRGAGKNKIYGRFNPVRLEK